MKVGKIKRDRIVALGDAKSIESPELRLGYVKTRFGSCEGQDIKGPDALARVHASSAGTLAIMLSATIGELTN